MSASDQRPAASDQRPVIPHCPHCDAEMPALGGFNWSLGNFVVLAVFCVECRRALDFQIVPVAAPPSPIARPS